MTLTLRPYQTQLIDDIRAKWAGGARNVLAVMPTGAGKTVTFSKLNADGERSCTIVHRQELVGQISKTYALTGIYHNIIAPQPVINFCIRLHIAATGRNFYDPRATVSVAGVDTLIRRFKPGDSWSNSIRRWTLDECFVAGTLVDNEPIECLKAGDIVTAFDERSGNLVRRAVVRTFKNKMPETIIRVATSHHVLYVTKGHPLWTQRGWVTAGELTNDDTLHTDTLHTVRAVGRNHQRGATIPLEKNGKHILHTTMRICEQRRSEGQAAEKDVALPHMRSAGDKERPFDDQVSTDWQGILHRDMQYGTCPQSFIRNDDENQFEICVKAHDTKQPNEARGVTGKDDENASANRAHAEGQRRERCAANDGRNKIGTDVRTTRVCEPEVSGNGFFKSVRKAGSLQNRLCASDNENCDRSGRVKPFGTGPEGVGQTEGRFLAQQRVVSVSVLERDDPRIPGDGYVYNIEVDGVHTYTANGLIVHNCHHARQDNKWGTAAALFPNAKGLGVTATACRGDNKSLHADQGGLFHALVQGPGMRELIDAGSLCDYRVFAPESGINEALLQIGKTGDFTANSAKAAQKAELIGDVVESYLTHIPGKQAIVFASGVQDAKDIADRFVARGVSAVALDGTNNDSHRMEQVARFESGETKILTNVSLFGEGFDVPACEAVIMARPTASFGLFVQQFGRALRPFAGKTHGVIIDHVGNVVRMAAKHGLPDTPRTWTLWQDETRKANGNPDAVPVRVCPECLLTYEAVVFACPHCGAAHVPAGRSSPDQVDGVLSEMSLELLATLRAGAAKIQAAEPAIPYGASEIVAAGIRARHRRNQAAQASLSDAMQRWGGMRLAAGDSDGVMQARFLYRFGVDCMTAQGLAERAALELRDTIMEATR